MASLPTRLTARWDEFVGYNETLSLVLSQSMHDRQEEGLLGEMVSLGFVLISVLMVIYNFVSASNS